MEFCADADSNLDIWHYDASCPDWPITSFNILRLEKLPGGLPLCKRCRVLESCSAVWKLLGRIEQINADRHVTIESASLLSQCSRSLLTISMADETRETQRAMELSRATMRHGAEVSMQVRAGFVPLNASAAFNQAVHSNRISVR